MTWDDDQLREQAELDMHLDGVWTARIAARFHLNGREIEMLRWMVRGESLDFAAEAWGTTRAGAKYHRHRLHVATSTTDVAALLRIVIAEIAREGDEARAEVARLRARVRVDAEDVERAGVTRSNVAAWLDASPAWARDDGGSGWEHKETGCILTIATNVADEYIADRIRWIAKYARRPELDILDEMAAASSDQLP